LVYANFFEIAAPILARKMVNMVTIILTSLTGFGLEFIIGEETARLAIPRRSRKSLGLKKWIFPSKI
jgi:hypothetical protein